jgi:hypothetical protein
MAQKILLFSQEESGESIVLKNIRDNSGIYYIFKMLAQLLQTCHPTIFNAFSIFKYY